MKLAYGIIALVVFWLVLVVRAAPAEWGLWLADPPAQFSGVSGTIWSGKAGNVVVPYQGSAYALGELEWETHPWSLLTGAPCADISTKLNNQQINGEVCAGLGGDLSVQNLQVTVPAAAAELWFPVSVGGELLVQVDELHVEDDAVAHIAGKGSWTDARFHNTQKWLQLGTVGFELEPNDKGGVHARFFDVEGPVAINLESNFTLNGSYETRGDIQLRANAQPEIGEILAHVAQEVGRGHYRVQWSGG